MESKETPNHTSSTRSVAPTNRRAAREHRHKSLSPIGTAYDSAHRNSEQTAVLVSSLYAAQRRRRTVASPGDQRLLGNFALPSPVIPARASSIELTSHPVMNAATEPQNHAPNFFKNTSILPSSASWGTSDEPYSVSGTTVTNFEVNRGLYSCGAEKRVRNYFGPEKTAPVEYKSPLYRDNQQHERAPAMEGAGGVRFQVGTIHSRFSSEGPFGTPDVSHVDRSEFLESEVPLINKDRGTKNPRTVPSSLFFVIVTLLYFLFVGVETLYLFPRSNLTLEQYCLSTWFWISSVYLVFLLLFCYEMVSFWKEYGFKRYFRATGHVVQFLCILSLCLNATLSFGVVPFVIERVSLLSSIISTCHVLRVVVMLRLLQTIGPLEIVAEALGYSLASLSWSALFLAIFLFIFANMGTRLLGTDFESEEMQRLWGDFGKTFYSLFMVATLDGIYDFVTDTVRLHPIGDRPWIALYFGVVVVFTSILWLNLVTGVIVDSYLHTTRKLLHHRNTEAALASRDEALNALDQLFSAAVPKKVSANLLPYFQKDAEGFAEVLQRPEGSKFGSESLSVGGVTDKIGGTQLEIGKLPRRSSHDNVTRGKQFLQPPHPGQSPPRGTGRYHESGERVLWLHGASPWELLMEPSWRKAIRGAKVPEHKAYDVLTILTDFAVPCVTVREFAEACLMVGERSTGRDVLIAQLEQRAQHREFNSYVFKVGGTISRTKKNITQLIEAEDRQQDIQSNKLSAEGVVVDGGATAGNSVRKRRVLRRFQSAAR